MRLFMNQSILFDLHFARSNNNPFPPEAIMHFHLFQISPYFRKKFTILPFPKKISIFIAKISDYLFLVIDYTNFEFLPYFCCCSTFPPISGKLLFPPTFANFNPDFVKFTSFLHTVCVFRFPLVWSWCIYASHNARNGRPCLELLSF